MRPPRRPPIDGDAILAARLCKGMTQEQVQDECARLGTRVWNLSRLEDGSVQRPDPRVFPVLAAVLGLEVHELLVKKVAA